MTTLALLGDRDLSYLTHRELEAAVAQLPPEVEARWAPTDSAAARDLDWTDGIWVLPGTRRTAARTPFCARSPARSTTARRCSARAAGASMWCSCWPSGSPASPRRRTPSSRRE